MEKQKMYAVILNFDHTSIDVLDVTDCPEIMEVEEYINDELDYYLGNSQWMVVYDEPYFNKIENI
jgi:hypothetical protein